VKRTTHPSALRGIQAARAEAAARAAAQPKRKRKPKRKARAEPVRVTAAPPIERRGERELARLGRQLRVESEVARRQAQLADLAAVMQGIPRGRQ
jgi:hypothetical protein